MNPQSVTWDFATLMAEDLQREAQRGTHRVQVVEPGRPGEWWFGLRAVMHGLWVMSVLLAIVALQNQLSVTTCALVTGVIAAPVMTAVATRSARSRSSLAR